MTGLLFYWEEDHSPHYYVKDEVLRTGVCMHANVVMDFLTGQI